MPFPCPFFTSRRDFGVALLSKHSAILTSFVPRCKMGISAGKLDGEGGRRWGRQSCGLGVIKALFVRNKSRLGLLEIPA